MNEEIIINDKKYISSKRVSEDFGYTSDYVGQLCRAGKLDSTLVGKTWFIEEGSVEKYKNSLLDNIKSANSRNQDNFDIKYLGQEKNQRVHKETLSGKSLALLVSFALILSMIFFKEEVLAYVRPMAKEAVNKASQLLARVGIENFSSNLSSASNYSSGREQSENNLKNNSKSDEENNLNRFAKTSDIFKTGVLKTGEYLEKFDSVVVETFKNSFNTAFNKSASESLASVNDFGETSFSSVARAGKNLGVIFYSTGSSFLDSYLSLGEKIYDWSLASMDYIYELPSSLVIRFGFGVNEFANDSKNVAIDTADAGAAVGEAILGTGSGIVDGINNLSLRFYLSVNDLFDINKYFGNFASDESEDLAVKTDDKDIEEPQASPAAPVTVIERVVERVVVDSSPSATAVNTGISEPTLDRRLQELNNKLSSEIYKLSSNQVSGSAINNVYQTIALTNKIDNLGSVDITASTWNGGTITGTAVTGSTWEGTTGTFSGSVSSGNLTVSGQLTLTGTATSTIAGDVAFDTTTLYVDSINNRVGIGTTSPKLSLHVTGTDGIVIPFGTTAQRPTARRGIIRYNTTTSQFEGYSGTAWAGLGGLIDVDGDTYILAESSAGADEDALFFYTAGTEKMRLTTAGNLGIGTTTPNSLLNIANTGTRQFLITDTNGSANLKHTYLESADGTLRFGMLNDALSTATEWARFDSSGNLGIGATGPVSRLDVRADATVDGSSRYISTFYDNTNFAAGTGPGLAFFGEINATPLFQQFANIKGIKQNSTSGNQQGNLVLSTSALGGTLTEALRIDSSQNVGLGTTSPYAKLSVVGASGVVAAKFHATSTTATSSFTGITGSRLTITGNTAGAFKIVPSSEPGTEALFQLRDTADTTSYFSINDSGLTTINADVGESVEFLILNSSNTTYGKWTSTGIQINPSALANASQLNLDGGNFTLTTEAAGDTTEIFTASGKDLTIDSGDDLIFQNNNINSAIFTATGRLGIGTTSPYAKLSVVGEAVARNFTATSTTATSTFAGGFRAAGTSGLTVLQNGKVGINTANFPISTAADSRLTVVESSLSNGRVIANFIGNSSADFQILNNGIININANGYSTFNGYINFHSGVAHIGLDAGTFPNNNIMLKTYGGDVALLPGGLNSAAKAVIVKPGANSTNTFQVQKANGTVVLDVDTTNDKLGIGTTTPWAKLSVAALSTNTAPLFSISTSTASATTTAFHIVASGKVGIATTSPAYRLHVDGKGDSNVAGFTDANGTCTINPTSTALVCSSDARLKKDIVSLSQENSLSKLLELNPVSYKWINQKDETERFGLIAQEVEEIFPEFVFTQPNGYKAVSYSSFIPLLIDGIKALASDVQKIIAKVSGLESRLSELEERVNALEGGNETQDATGQAPSTGSTSSPQAGSGQAPSTSSGQATITIQGDNPSRIEINTSYLDLGAIAKDSLGNDLSIKTYLDGAEIQTISIDTSTSATYTIRYEATDGDGQATTAERVVEVFDPNIIIEETPADTATTTPESV